MSSKPTDDQLRQAIDAIFNKYDDDKSGTLEGKEISNLINDAFKSLGRNREVKGDEVGQFVKAIDKNGDGKISKAELFEILKKLINGGWSALPLYIILTTPPPPSRLLAIQIVVNEAKKGKKDKKGEGMDGRAGRRGGRELWV